MLQITLEVTDAQATRIREAFRDPETGELPTAADIVQWIRGQIKVKVYAHELNLASTEAEIIRKAELIAEGW